MGPALTRAAQRLAVAVAAAGCAELPYEPAAAAVLATPQAFPCVEGTVRAGYPRLAVCDREAFRLQSEWVDDAGTEVPGQRRATVFADARGAVAVVVEVRYLHFDLLGHPTWTAARGAPDLERALAAAIETACGSLGRAPVR
jgi:hypothetical protein